MAARVASPKYSSYECGQNQATNRGATPLFIAAQTGHLELAWRHPRVHAQNGNLEVARLLLDAKPDKDKARNDGATPLRIAAQIRNLKVARLLLDAKADKDKAMNMAPPHCASQLKMGI